MASVSYCLHVAYLSLADPETVTELADNSVNVHGTHQQVKFLVNEDIKLLAIYIVAQYVVATLSHRGHVNGVNVSKMAVRDDPSHGSSQRGTFDPG